MNISQCYTILREAIPPMDLEKIYHVRLPQRHMDKSREREKTGLINSEHYEMTEPFCPLLVVCVCGRERESANEEYL